MKFSQDWFTYNIPHLEHLMKMLPARKEFLEIGAFEGRATCWFFEHALDDDGRMTCIDPFTGSMEHEGMDLSNLYDHFRSNVDEVRKPNQVVHALRGYSYDKLPELIQAGCKYDFIYIDGSHTAADVLIDACMSWPMLKKGGIMLFDDYHWNPGGYNEYQTPKRGVDAFSHCFADQFKVVHDGYQIAVQKI